MRPDCLAGFLLNKETSLLIGGSGWGTVFAASCGRCTTRNVAVQVMMERANCFGALKTWVPVVV